MNRTHKLTIALVSSITFSTFYGFGNKTFFATRSQAVNSVRELTGWEREINLADQDHCYGTAAITVEYNRSFSPKKIRQFLFCTDCELIFSGSKVPNRGANDILADYFGLPLGYKSKVIFTPVISNFIFDLNWYQGLDSVAKGMYFRVHAPIVHTKWDLNMCEQVILDNVPTFSFYPAGYMGPEKIVRDDMNETVQEAFKGLKTVGDLEPLKYGKIWGRQTAVHIAEIQLALGWNFLLTEDYHLGLNIRTAIPTGNKPKAEYLFEPIVGNGHHWELGGGLTGHCTVWRSEDEENSFGIYLDANVTHLFNETQKRSYDLKVSGTDCGAGSRYMLLQEFDCTSTNLHLGSNGPVAPSQYIGRLLPAINATTLDSKISIGVQADVVLKLAYQRRGFELDLGYNFYGRSKEKLKHRECFAPCKKYAIKGDAQVYGFNTAQEAVRLNAIESNATIKKGQGVTNFVDGDEFENLNIDNPIGAFDDSNNQLNALNDADSIVLKGAVGDLAHTSTAVLLTDCDIDECSGLLPKAITHKVFIYFNNVWLDAEDVVPYIGGGVSAEFANTDSRKNSGYSQWALWVKGGISY